MLSATALAEIKRGKRLALVLWAADEKRRMAETKKGLRNGKIQKISAIVTGSLCSKRSVISFHKRIERLAAP